MTPDSWRRAKDVAARENWFAEIGQPWRVGLMELEGTTFPLDLGPAPAEPADFDRLQLAVTAGDLAEDGAAVQTELAKFH